MQGIIHPPAFDGVIMDVGHFLLHHFHVVNALWVGTFLPELVVTVGFVRPFMPGQLRQNMFSLLFPVTINDLPGGEGFEITDLFGQIQGSGDEMELVFHDNIGVEGETAVALQKAQRF